MIIDNERHFVPNEFVVGSIHGDGIKDGVAVVSDIFPGGLHEVIFLCDHSKTSIDDPIRVLFAHEMRPATIDEIMAQRHTWERDNRHKLSFTVIEQEGKCLLGPEVNLN